MTKKTITVEADTWITQSASRAPRAGEVRRVAVGREVHLCEVRYVEALPGGRVRVGLRYITQQPPDLRIVAA